MYAQPIYFSITTYLPIIAPTRWVIIAPINAAMVKPVSSPNHIAMAFLVPFFIEQWSEKRLAGPGVKPIRTIDNRREGSNVTGILYCFLE